ncbi:MAG: ATP-binding protein [Hyphomicrobiaceae bacterium]|nr:ATP-binding protein [Hyphomicrobiaceae bacterium]
MPPNDHTTPLEVRSTIRRKIISVVLIGIITTILLVTAANSWRETARYLEVKTAEITSTANVFASAVADAVAARDRIGVLKPLRAIGKIPSFVHAKVEDLDGNMLAALGTGVALEESENLPIFLRSSLNVGVDIVKGGKKVGHLTVLVKTDDLRQSLIEGLLTGLAAAILSGAIGVIIAFRLQRRITDPLRKLTQTMFEVERSQDFGKTVEHVSDDETGVLVSTFNKMLAQIRARDDRLARHRDELEQTVEERTRDLRVAKEAAEDANAAKSDFLATMSHEIRTPMNGMLVMAELLASANLVDRYRRYADVVVKSGQSLLTIINDILDFSKIESGKMELEQIGLDPADIVDDVLNLFWDKASTNGLDLAGYVAPDVPSSMLGDPVRLNQILSNLVNNALKFTQDGYVKVVVEMAETPNGKGVRFGVRDTGIGIPQDKLATVFESFSQADQSTTRRFGGTGLGLAICKRLVSAMNGEISVLSAEGEGSEFFFIIPCAEVADPAEKREQARTDTLGKCLVSVDGEATSASIGDYLADRGVEVLTVTADELSAAVTEDVDAVLAEPDRIAKLPSETSSAGGKPYRVSISRLGDALSDELIREDRAHDILMRPISRKATNELIDRLDAGAPRGRALLERHQSTKPPSYQGADVLVADDSPVNREVVAEALRQMSVLPDLVEDGAAAVRAATAKVYHVIFMDCSMPEMDGFEATRTIRAAEAGTGRRVPIVALTAHIAGSNADEWREAGMDSYLTKPFRITDLVETFEQFLPEEMRVSEEGGDVERASDGGDVASTGTGSASAVDETVEPDRGDETPVIDENVLCEAIGCSIEEAGELVLRVLTLFEEHAPAALLKVAEMARDEGAGQIGDAAHALKSMARNIGAMRLGAACDRLEDQARSGNIQGLNQQLIGLKTELVAVLEKIESYKSEEDEANVNEVVVLEA